MVDTDEKRWEKRLKRVAKREPAPEPPNIIRSKKPKP
jgi:hypothetical protein